MRIQHVVIKDLYDPFGVDSDFATCSGGVAPGYSSVALAGQEIPQPERSRVVRNAGTHPPTCALRGRLDNRAPYRH